MFFELKKIYTEKSKLDFVIYIVFNMVFATIILFGAYISVKMNRGGRSLWYDEMALVESISLRSLEELCTSGLDNCQSAPALWLYLVKIVITILGNNEFNLRIVSVISYIGTVLIACVLGKKVFQSSFPMGYGAFVALIGFFVRYSIVCKPYESDALCVLLVILSFYLYTKGRINTCILSIIWAVLIWISNPVCFFEGGILVAYIIPDIVRKNWQNAVKYVVVGAVILTSFVCNYFLWLRQSVGYMQDYWEGSQWPLIIINSNDYHNLRLCIDVVFGVYEKAKYVILILFIVGILVSIVRKNQLVIGLYISTFITLIASYAGFFPVSDRLWCFAYPFIAIISIYTIEQIISAAIKKAEINHILIAICLLILTCTQTGWRYLYSFNLWWKNEEINAELDYLESVITDDDNVYVSVNAKRGYEYKYRDGKVVDAVISDRDAEDVTGMVDDIASLDNCYVVTTHYSYVDDNEPLTMVFNKLREMGYVQLVYYDHQTALVYYCSDGNNKKNEVNPEDYWY